MQKPVHGLTAATTTTATARSERIKAIAFMCLAVTMFGCLDTTAKYLGTVVKLPPMQIVWIRFTSQMLLVLIVLGPLALRRLSRSNRIPTQILRSFLLLGATVFNFTALLYLRLDQTTTMFFLTPLTVALLAGPLLGEWVGWRRFIAIFVGFMGILVAVRPGVTDVHPAFLLSLGAMLSYAGFSLVTRHLTAHDTTEVTLFYSMLAGIIVIAPFAWLSWVWPDHWSTWALLASTGLWGGMGHYMFILSMRLAQASVVAPFVYFGLVANSTLGYAVFGDLPDHWTLIGASIVVASGLYLFWREQQLREDAQD